MVNEERKSRGSNQGNWGRGSRGFSTIIYLKRKGERGEIFSRIWKKEEF